MKQYILRLEIPVLAEDDPEARFNAQDLVQVLTLPANTTAKLQEVYVNKQPRKIAFELNSNIGGKK